MILMSVGINRLIESGLWSRWNRWSLVAFAIAPVTLPWRWDEVQMLKKAIFPSGLPKHVWPRLGSCLNA